MERPTSDTHHFQEQGWQHVIGGRVCSRYHHGARAVSIGIGQSWERVPPFASDERKYERRFGLLLHGRAAARVDISVHLHGEYL